MNVTFAGSWNTAANNEDVYGNGRPPCKREIYVILSKLSTGEVWCESDEMNKIREFLNEDLLGSNSVSVDKGIHRDKLEGRFGKHITVVVTSGCRTGDTFHLYGGIKRGSSSWEVSYINAYNPQKRYRADHCLYRAIPPAPMIVAVGSIPPARPGSPADLDRTSF